MNEPTTIKTGTRQTKTYLQELLAAHGLWAKKQLGQNFLIDLNLLDVLLESARLSQREVVLEIGAGTGGLTTRLAALAAKVVSVELDPGFYRLAQQETSSFANVTLLHVDALAGKNHMNPALLDTVRRALEETGSDAYCLVANLPYNVATPVVGNLLLSELPPQSMTVTLQQEFADRLCAAPGTADYGPITVLVQLCGKAEVVRVLPPSAFWPRPKVQSAIVRVEVNGKPKEQIDDLERFYRFVRDLFVHRRKNLRGGIAAVPGYKNLKSGLGELLASIGLGPDGRAESLGPEKLYELYLVLRRALG